MDYKDFKKYNPQNKYAKKSDEIEKKELDTENDSILSGSNKGLHSQIYELKNEVRRLREDILTLYLAMTESKTEIKSEQVIRELYFGEFLGDAFHVRNQLNKNNGK